MKGERSRRTRAGKPKVGRNQRPGAGKGRLREARRERKLSALADLTQVPEAAESAASPSSAASNLGGAGRKNASAGEAGRAARHHTAKADPMKESVATQVSPETNTEAAPKPAPGGRGRRRRAEGETALSRADRKAVTTAANARKKTAADAVGTNSMVTAPDAPSAKGAAPAARPRRTRKASRPAARSTVRSAAQSTEMSAGAAPAGSVSQSVRLGASRPAAGAALSGTAVSAAAAPAGTGSFDSSGSLPFHLASDAFSLAQEAAEIGAAALRDVAAASSLPELIEAQMRLGRAASEIWMRQLRIATSIFPVPTGPW